MSTTASQDDGFEVVVSLDGTLSVDADELARHGVRPGAHLRVIPADVSRSKQASAFGYLSAIISSDAADALAAGLDAGKAERLDALGLS